MPLAPYSCARDKDEAREAHAEQVVAGQERDVREAVLEVQR